MSGREVFEAWAAMPLQLAELVALSDDAGTALVLDPARPELPARVARTVVDLHAAHIGSLVAVMFEAGDPDRPIVMGVLHGGTQRANTMSVEADGERLIVRAEHQLVLRCGRACITLTRAGKVLIEGTYLCSRSSGVNRIKGGAVQIN